MWLQERNITYTERKTSNKNILKEMMIMGYRTTPLIVIGDEVIVGFNSAKLAEILELT